MSGNKLSTDDVKTGGGGIPKILQPGNTVCTINKIELEPFKFKEGGYHIILHLEGPDLGKDFEGFFIDKNDESKGRYKGQVGQVKASEWAFADGETKSGVPVSRDTEMLKFIKNLCTALGIEGRSGETIEDLVKKFNDEQPFKGKKMEYCICGKEYTNRGGFTNYELFLPKYIKGGAPFGSKGVIKFNPDEHIRKKKVENVTEFGSDDTTSLGAPEAESFKLD